jgi:hypothetical protein
LAGTGTWQIPLDQVEASAGRLVPIGEHGQFVVDDVEPGPAVVCVGGQRSGADDFRARGCLEVDVRPPMTITLAAVEGSVQVEVVRSE